MLALALAFVLYVNFSQKKILTGEMQRQKLAYQYQEDLLHSNILTQEEERKRIARDLHDEIGSKLNVVFLNIYRLKEATKGQAEVASITDEVETLLNTTIATTRRISHDLLPPTLEDFGLVEAIKELQHHFHQTGRISIAFELKGKEQKIENPLIELSLFRVLQELINNSIRHGEATAIHLLLDLNSSAIKMEYEDDGKGFESTQMDHKKGLGLKNIESRLQMIQAQHQYQSASGKGFQMKVEIPILKAPA